MEFILNAMRRAFVTIFVIFVSLDIVPAYANETNYSTEIVKIIDEHFASQFTVTDQIFLLNYNSFTRYHTSDFSQYQYGNNCGPTLLANVLSYYKSLGYGNLYFGTITQSMYDDICARLGYSISNGSDLNKIPSALKSYVENAGYGFSYDKYLINLWSDVTRDLKFGYPVIMSYNNHGYLVLGYRVMDGIKQLYTCTGWSAPEYTWINFNSSNMNMTSVHIYLK